MKKNVLILSSSPRRKGNSDLLCDRFLEGAKDAGHNVEKIFLKDKDINMEVTDAAKDIMVREGYDPVYGARPLKRYIGNTLETIIARKLIAGQIRNGDTIVVDGDGDNIDIVVK